MTQKYQKNEGSNNPTAAEPSKAEQDDVDKVGRQKQNAPVDGKPNKTSFSDDSDLASLAREFEEEEHFQESPFIRKVNDGTQINTNL